MNKILKELFALQEVKYGDFIAKLTPSVKRDFFIGVRVPLIRKMVPSLTNDEKEEFLNSLPHHYYEENLLHGFIIQKIKNYDECLNRVDEFLPYVDNWAVSDTMCPHIFIKHKPELYKEILKWIKSKHTYTVRFAIDMLMTYYLDESFDEEHLKIVSSIHRDDYYINMMIAWYFATALAKQYTSTIKIIEGKSLDKWIHNKSIQKAIESNRINDDVKNYLKSLKI